MVSVIIASYNSSFYILETLKSIKAQTYPEFELIVTDDCSTDNSVEMAEKWIEENSGRFLSTKIVTSDINRGIPGNLNRGLKEAKGEWIKFIAADDRLLPNCLMDNLAFAGDHPDASFIFSNGIIINAEGVEVGSIKSNKRLLSLDNKGQYRTMLKASFVLTPSAFVKRSTLELLGGYNEEIRLLEDYPMWLKALRNGYRFYYIDRETVEYRKHDQSISASTKNARISDRNEAWLEMVDKIYTREFKNDLLRHKLLLHYLNISLLKRSYNYISRGNRIGFIFFHYLRILFPINLLRSGYRKTIIFMHNRVK